MRLHCSPSDFDELCQLTSEHFCLPENAARRDYFITLILKRLSDSDYVEEVVFKGGTSLSKCFPGSIERFSEDIDLTYLPADGLSGPQINKRLKQIEECLIGDAKYELIESERSERNKSSYVWFNNDDKDAERVKLEIGSSVRPHPYHRRTLKSYIHEYLLHLNRSEVIADYQLSEVEVNVLDIERTFVDKLFSVKRHALCGTLATKVRHIYDVVRLFQLPEIQGFLADHAQLKEIVRITKNTDGLYMSKRKVSNYNPHTDYDFKSWRHILSDQIRERYERLHKDLLYTNEKQNFDLALHVFGQINEQFVKIGE